MLTGNKEGKGINIKIKLLREKDAYSPNDARRKPGG